MNRRRVIAAGIAVAICPVAIGAPKANARVGYLELVKESDGEQLYREFIEGLQSHGYVEGRSLQVLRRSARARPERLTPLAVELAAARVDVILAASIPAARFS